MPDIKISLEAANSGEPSILRVDGVVDTMTASELEKVMSSLLLQKRYRIVVDLAGVDYISSAGWGIFVSNIREVRANRGDIKLARMMPSVYEVFELLEFDSILRAFDSLDRAREDFGAESPSGSFKTEPAPAPPSPLRGPAVSAPIKTENLEEALLRLVADDPFYSIGELHSELVRRGFSVGFWGLVRRLWKKKLFSAKSRYRYARSSARQGLRIP
ncbi:MAG: STAS domain-containing protein [candidate division Zixibacteria bacterium]|nr:STAS domain-containing protein [candidate division Zixibacteria bacterium]MCI0595712.1 STAS domain-containing protein [candidate division Zixibacteria bacterium]